VGYISEIYCMSNKLTVIYDYRVGNRGRTRSKKDTTIELGPWLDIQSNKDLLYNKRCFYILKPNSENIIKFGIAGLDGRGGAWGRLHQYINEYGFSEDLNPCAGIKMLYLAGTVYNPNVQTVNSAIYRKELACKQHFRDTAIKGRGFERIFLEKIDELFKIVDDKSNKSFQDIEQERRTSDRLSQAGITADDKVIKIISHDTKGGKSQAKTQYKTEWNRPYTITENKKVRGKTVTTTTTVPFTLETANKLITYLDGAKALEVYHILHPEAKFRD